MRRSPSGFTLIELLIVISIIGVLAAVLLPSVLENRDAANASADAMQLGTHNQWFEFYRQKHNRGLPSEGGHKFVLSTWKVIDHTAENFDKYFSPGARDNDGYYQDLRKNLLRGEIPWSDVRQCTPADTHYAGRAKQDLKTVGQSGNEALMANANDGMWTLRDGTVNILLASGAVRTLSYPMMQELYGLGEKDVNNPVATWGPNSPIPECRKLDR